MYVCRGGETVYCLWLSRDEEDIAGKTQNNLTLATTGFIIFEKWFKQNY